MKLYRIWQEVNNDYDTFDSAVVAAYDEEDARSINPIGILDDDNEPVRLAYTQQELKEDECIDDMSICAWTTRENVKVKYLGEGSTNIKRGVICASYNAG